jgi:hypothetical protein
MTYHHHQRLDKAIHHLESLDAELAAWRKGNPYRTWEELDGNGTKKVLWVELLKPLPAAEPSLIIGDCLQNLRNALDNLAFELALVHKGGSLSKSIEGDSEFPIFRTCSDDSLKKLNRMLRGVHPHAKAIIEGLQPYNRGQTFFNDPLWQLNQLAVEDKHRLPHVTLVGTASISFWVHGFGADEIEPIFYPIEDRAPIARYPAVDETGAEVNVNLTPTFSIAFGQRAPKQLSGMPVPQRLTHIHRHITE